MPPARKGDLAIVKRRHSSVGAFGSGTQGTENDRYAVGTVRKTTRTGDIVEVDLIGGGIARRSDHSWQQVFTEPASRIDVGAVLADSLRAHHYPGHPNQYQERESLEDIVTIAKRHRKPHPVTR